MMKKLVLLATLAAFSSTAMAGTVGGYVQGNIGASKLEAKADGEKEKKNNTGVSVAVGSDTGAVRYALDYSRYGKISGSDAEDEKNYENIELKSQSVGLSAIYDFENGLALTPYAGVRVGYNQLKLNASGAENGEAWSDSVKKNKVGFGVVAGVQYAFAPNLALDAGVEYNRLGTLKIEDEEEDFKVKMNQYGVKVGLRYNF